MKRLLSFKHYLAFLRRQPKHMQHVYGIIFSAAITAFLGAAILYFDYGFWRDTYNRSEIIETKETQKANVTTQSPGDMIGGFLHEASNRIRDIKTSSSSLLEGKEEYKKDYTNDASSSDNQ